MTVPLVSSTTAFLRQARKAAPQGMALVNMMALAAATPVDVRVADLRALHVRYPLTMALTADSLARIIDPDGRYTHARKLCVGVVRPSGYRAESLVYDRRLGVLAWVDRAGDPTLAPRQYRETPITIVGPAIGHVPDRMVYAFSERQDREAVQRTIEYANRQLTDGAIAAPPSRPSPYDTCAPVDVQLYPTVAPGVAVSLFSEPAGRAIRRVAPDPGITVVAPPSQGAVGSVRPMLPSGRAEDERQVEGVVRPETSPMLDQVGKAL